LGGVEHLSGANGVEAAGPLLVADALKGALDVMRVAERRELPVADFGVVAVTGEGKPLAEIALMEVAEALAAKGKERRRGGNRTWDGHRDEGT